VRHVHDDAEAVHLGDDGVTELREASIVRLARAVADGIPTVVGQVHHAHAEFLENADEP
jgi:tyrosine-protein phosphatase YwqE